MVLTPTAGACCRAPPCENLCFCCMQMLENDNEVIIHGYAYQDWIREISNPQVSVLLPDENQAPVHSKAEWRYHLPAVSEE